MRGGKERRPRRTRLYAAGEERRANDADGSFSSAASEDDRLAIDAEHLTVHVGNLPEAHIVLHRVDEDRHYVPAVAAGDRKSTRLNSSHSQISYAVFCLKK